MVDLRPTRRISAVMTEPSLLPALRPGYRAAVIGASGAIGGAVAARLEADPNCAETLRLQRAGPLHIDLADEASVAAAAEAAGELDLIFIATGALYVEVTGEAERRPPEKALSHIDPLALAAAFQINALGPALAIKHFSSRLPRDRRSILAALSARVGSIGDNRLGGWHGYRAAKAALNQILRGAAIELRRRRPQAVVAALHPGTVESGLSRPFRPQGAADEGVSSPEEAAANLLGVLNELTPEQSGGFWDYAGRAIPW